MITSTVCQEQLQRKLACCVTIPVPCLQTRHLTYLTEYGLLWVQWKICLAAADDIPCDTDVGQPGGARVLHRHSIGAVDDPSCTQQKQYVRAADWLF